MKYILSADIGTTALKAAVFDENGRVLGAGLREYATLAPLPGRAEMDPETYLAAFRGSVADALRSSGVRADELLVIGLSTQGETTLLLDENDRPLGNAIVWLDNRALAEAADISAHFGAEEIQRRTGQVGADAIWPGAKLLWIRRNEPERFEKLRRAVQLESWFSLLLTGTAAGEDSILGSSVYFDIRTRSWWPEMLEYIGIPETYLPEIRKPGAIVGHITEEAAGRFGLSSGTLLSIGGIDLACGAVGVGNIRPGAFSDVTGSALCTMTMTDRIVLTLASSVSVSTLSSKRSGEMVPWYHDCASKYFCSSAELNRLPCLA